MSPFTSSLPGALQDAGLVLGLVISLTIASYLIKDNLLARLGQYVLVGSGLGYMAVLAWRNVLWPRLFAPLIADPMSWLTAPEATLLKSWLPVILGLLMWAGGVELLRRPPQGTDGRGILRLLAIVPAAVLVGVGLGVALSGAIQGTLWPQLAAAVQSPLAAVATAGDARPAADQATWLVRFITLLITGGVLIHFQLGRAFSASARQPAPRRASDSEDTEIAAEEPNIPYRMLILKLLEVWGGIGRRALWLAAGMIFARLAAARFSLALARLDYFLFEVPRSELWQLLWAAVRGAGS